MTYEVALPLSWADKKNKKPITGTVFLVINFRPIKADEIKREGKAYQKVPASPPLVSSLLSPPSILLISFLQILEQEVEERATAVKDELVKRARESGAMFGKLLQRIEKERPFACAPIPEGSLTIASMRGIESRRRKGEGEREVIEREGNVHY